MQQDIEVQRKIIEILRILKKHSSPVGARTVAKELTGIGYLLNERTVRYHLKLMDENGLTMNHGYSGRTLTEKGLEELNNALVSDQIAAKARREELEELLGKLSIPEQNQETEKDKKTPSKEEEKPTQTP